MTYDDLIEYGRRVFNFHPDDAFACLGGVMEAGRKSTRRCPHEYYDRAAALLCEKLVQYVDEQQAERAKTGWKPIATAPEGPVVLLCDRFGNRWADVSPGEWWHLEGCGYPPTHWQPLPEPPSEG